MDWWIEIFILSLKVKESYLLFVYIYICIIVFCTVMYDQIFLSNTNNFSTDLFDSIDWTLTDTTTPSQSASGNYNNEGVLYIS